MSLIHRTVRQVLWEFPTFGHAPLLVLADNFDRYIAKSGKGQFPSITIINEFICSLFLELWSIPTPEFAVIEFGAGIIDPSVFKMGTNKLSYYANPCFGSKYLDGAIEVSSLLDTEAIAGFNKLENPKDLLWIAMFDLWIENDDRKPLNPNLLLKESTDSRKLKVYAIDHAYTFLSTDYKILDPAFGVSQSVNDSILYADIAKHIGRRIPREEIQQMRLDFLKRVELCKANFFNIAQLLPSELGFDQSLQTLLYRFLFNEERNNSIFIEFLSRLENE